MFEQRFGGGAAGIPRLGAGEPPPVSYAQQRMWLLEQLVGRGLYNVPEGFRIRGPLDVAALGRAIDRIVERHEVLRTTIASTERERELVQVVHPAEPVRLDPHDLRALPEDHRAAEVQRVALGEVYRAFDLAAGPLVRATLLRVADDEHLLLVMFHHVVYDAWSSDVLLDELLALYDQETTGAPAGLAPLPIQYADFAAWQRRELSGAKRERDLAYWRRTLAEIPTLQLAFDHPRPDVETHEGDVERLVLPPALAQALEQLGRDQGCTQFMVLLAVFFTLLTHHTGQTDFGIGTIVANRRRPELDRLIGCFVNTLVMRGDLSGNPSFRALLGRVREVALGAIDHQDIAFQQLVDALQPERDLSRPPLAQVFFTLQSAAVAPRRSHQLAVERWRVPTERSKFDLSLEAMATADGLVLELGYSSALFDPPTIRRMRDHLGAIIAQIVADPDRPILELALLTEDERRQLAAWNATAAEVPCALCLHQLVERQVARTPERTAVTFAGERLSYAELDARANRLAHHLRAAGGGPGTRVGLCLERSHELPIALLAILKAGAAYVPLDPAYPRDRLGFMVADSGASLLVTSRALLDRIDPAPPRVVCVEDRASWADLPVTAPAVALDPERPAYVLFTSGSTGRPKGVEVPHRALVNLMTALARTLEITQDDTLVAITTPAFDMSGLELYLPITVGATMIVAPGDAIKAGEQLRRLIESSGATLLQATPSSWRMLIDAGWRGTPGLRALCGGEPLPRELANQLLGRADALWNLYGPTEVTIWATCQAMAPGDGPVSLGRPLANLQAHLLNAAQHPVPLGAPGELYLGGAGVAHGYVGRPALTAERFVPDPFSDRPGARMYRTGDLARLRPSGALEFVGRVDHQVKLRGFRIELGEIEAVLLEHASVAAAVVILREDRPGQRRLVAYVVPSGAGVDAAALRGFVAQRVPDYMVPAAFVALDALPVTPNQKLDRRALPAPDLASGSAFEPPRTPGEQALAQIWSEVLGVSRVGIHDSFFELGGDSLTVIRVVARANKAGLRLTSKQLFQHPRIAELAALAGTITVLAEQGEHSGPVPFTSSMRWWIELLGDGLAERHGFYSIAFVLEPREPLDEAAIAEVLRVIVRHHDALRLRMVRDGEGWQLLCEAAMDVPLERIDVSQLPDAEREAAVTDHIREFQIHFDLAHGPLFKTAIIDRGPDRPRQVLLACHYLPADLESWQILLGDVDTLYDQHRRGKPLELPNKGTSYRQWAERLRQHASSNELRLASRYWTSDRWKAMPRLPIDLDTAPDTLGSGHVLVELLTVEETRYLLDVVLKASEALIDAALISALVDAFEPWTGRRTLGIHLIGHGRQPLFEDVDLSRTVGWLSIIAPALVELTGIRDPDAALRAVNDQLRGVPTWGVGYGILRYGDAGRDVAAQLKQSVVPEIFFNYTGPKTVEYQRFRMVGGHGGFGHDLTGARPYQLQIVGGIVGGQLELRWEYSEHRHHRETIERLLHATMAALRRQIAHRCARSSHA